MVEVVDKTKIINIYDYDNRKVEIEIPDKEIFMIFVDVLSGDETGFIKFFDGTLVRFDSSKTRIHDYYDGDYLVTGEENIQKWINFEFDDEGETKSYARQRAFYDMEDDEE